MQTAWSPDTYLAFAEYRARPADDLMARLTMPVPGAMFDLGCGPGTLTRKLKDRWTARAVTGIDSSAEMLAEARKKYPGGDITWAEADIAEWTPPSPPALIFANASLHWVPNHTHLFPQLISRVAPGGEFAVQMPITADAPYHRCIEQVLAKPRWRDRLAGVRSHAHPLSAATYYDLISPYAAKIDIWETHYHHVLADALAVTAWASGTALVPYLTPLDASERSDFLSAYAAEAAAAYIPQADGRVLFTMRRLFVLATRAGFTRKPIDGRV